VFEDAPVAVVAMFRADLLPASETFIRGQGLAVRRHEVVFAGVRRLADGLELPPARVVIGEGRSRWRRAVLRRLVREDPDARLVAACRGRGVALVHAHFGPDGVRALGLADGLGVPLVVTYWGFDATLTDPAMRAAGGPLEEYVRRRGELWERASRILAVSQAIADHVVRQGAPPAKIRVLHTAVQPAAAAPVTPREPVVLFVGRHVEKKGLDDLIAAMARVDAEVPGARLLVLGDGPLRLGLEDVARRTLRGVHFAGWRDPAGVAEAMAGARVLCVPSRRATNGDSEGLPTVVLEAMAAGLPVVGTRHSGIPEAVTDGESGLLVPEGDVEGLSRALVAVLRDEDLARRLGARGRDQALQRFDVSRQAAQLECHYDEVLGLAPAVARGDRLEPRIARRELARE